MWSCFIPQVNTHIHTPLIIIDCHLFLFFHLIRTVKGTTVEFAYTKRSFYLSLTFTGIDLIAAFYGCLYAGVIPVTVRPPHPQNLAATLPTVRMIIDVSSHHWVFVIKIKKY